ncbi:MAG: hypothetical protein RL385_1084 [Pseudomonadota bacterium]
MPLSSGQLTENREAIRPHARCAGRLPVLALAGLAAHAIACDAGGGAVDMAVPVSAAASADAATAPDVPGVEAGSTDDAPRFSALVMELFGPGCVLGRCHTTLAPAGGLSLSGQRVREYAALVNQPSTQDPTRMRVAPFDPAASYLMEKLESETPHTGTRMPPMAQLPADVLARVRAWIAAGARDD